MADGQFYLDLSISISEDASAKLRSMADKMGSDSFNRRFYSIMSRTAGHTRTILRKELPKEYHVKGGEVGSAVKGPRINGSGYNMGCVIPIKGPRLGIGSKFKASGSARGWESLRKKYRVKAKIVKSGESTLPQSMGSYGGMPPFRNSLWSGVTFTREGKSRLPIRKVVGIAIPQMPMTRSREDVERDIREYLEERIDHEFGRLFTE